MQYRFLTQDQQDDIVATAMKNRETEHFHYQHNKAVYDEMLAILPNDDWPEEIQRFKDATREEIASSAGSLSDMAFQYQYRDRLRLLAITEQCEATRVEAIYKGLESQFKGDTTRMQSAIDRVNSESGA